jgi:hypothetical protein
VETTTHSPHPVIQRYLAALETSAQAMPEFVRAEALADAQEFLQSEWEALGRRRRHLPDDSVYHHFVCKFGSPEEVAAGYAEAAGAALSLNEAPASAKAAAPPSSRSGGVLRNWLVAAMFMQTVLLVAAGFWLLNLRVRAAAAASQEFTAVPPAAVETAPERIASAGRVVSAQPGPTPRKRSIDPQAALGAPDCQSSEKQHAAYYCLGYGGELVVEFENCRLIDGQGADLAIFEVGFPAEPVDVAVSEDGENWFPVGRTGLDATTLDLSAHGLSGKEFRYVRIVDAKTKISDKAAFWGADIDAIVALHTTRPR